MPDLENYNIGDWLVGGLTRHVNGFAHSVRQRLGTSAAKTIFAIAIAGATLTANMPSAEAAVTNIESFAPEEYSALQPSLRLISGSATDYWAGAMATVSSWNRSKTVEVEVLPAPFI